jgi:hypothetical protein
MHAVEPIRESVRLTDDVSQAGMSLRTKQSLHYVDVNIRCAILEPTLNGKARFTKPPWGATCREPRRGASSGPLPDCDCDGPFIAFCLANPMCSQLGKAARRANRGFCRHAFHVVGQNIPLSGNAGARESTNYGNRQCRAVPLQSQPNLSRVFAISDRNRAHGQRRPDHAHAASGDFLDAVRRNTPRGALSRSAIRRGIQDVQGKRSALVVGSKR